MSGLILLISIGLAYSSLFSLLCSGLEWIKPHKTGFKKSLRPLLEGPPSIDLSGRKRTDAERMLSPELVVY